MLFCRLLIEEEIQQLYIKKQQQVLERELKKFEMKLSKSRPKFSNYTCCTKRNFVSSDDEDFWKTARKLKNKVDIILNKILITIYVYIFFLQKYKIF